MWFINSWKKYFSEQLPNYINKNNLSFVESKLNLLSPLVDSKDVDLLQNKLHLVEKNKAFILHMGECAESFINCFNKHFMQDFYKFFLQIADIVENELKLPVIKIGRIAGQFAKPRSQLVEENGIPAFRGEIINSFIRDVVTRRANPYRMISAYYSSKKALEYLNDYYEQISFYSTFNKYNKTIKDINKDFLFVSHEALLLNYEASLTRKVKESGYYNLSAHMVWLGARTNKKKSPHIEYLKGINNPIALKVHKDISPEYLVKLIKVLNPQNISGKIVLILRLNKNELKDLFPLYIKAIKECKLNLIFICDPMHSNTKSYNNYKVRYFKDILETIKTFISICKFNNIFPQGLHLEAIHLNITECVGGEFNTIKEEDIFKNYQTKCDPRLNKTQTMELIAKTVFFMQN